MFDRDRNKLGVIRAWKVYLVVLFEKYRIDGPVGASLVAIELKSSGEAPRRPRKVTHLRSDRITHPGHGGGAAKPLAGKALSAPPSGGRWVIFGEQSRVNFRECRRRGFDPLREFLLDFTRV